MNWREFTDMTTAMAEGRAEASATKTNRAMNKAALSHTAWCWQRFTSACSKPTVGAPTSRPSLPSPWLPPLP